MAAVHGFQFSLSGLFEDNKLTCSFLIATALQRHAGEISPTEWSLLLRLARVAVGFCQTNDNNDVTN